MVDRFQLAAVIDRLIFGSDVTFERADAIALYEMVPPELRRSRWSNLFSFGASASFPGGSVAGVAAGGGNVKMQNDSSFEFDSAGKRALRAGQWKVYPARDRIEIEQVMNSDGDEGKSAAVVYTNGEPLRMELQVNQMVSLGFVSIGRGVFRPWKTVRPLQE